MKILSLGAGVNSTALLVLKSQGKVDFDVAIFADTGGEYPETYRYIEEIIKPFCQKNHIKFEQVKKDNETLYEYSVRTKFIPSRRYGSCRDNFKIQVIKKFLIKNFPSENIETIIGFCKGEEKRREGYQCITSNFSFPLMEMGLDRDGCIKVIAEAGLPIPPKSGCFYCPHQPMKSWINLLKTNPPLYAKAEALEKNGRRYPELYLPYDYPLELLRKTYEAAQKGNEPAKKEIQKSLLSQMPRSLSCPMCELEDNECG